MLFPLILAYNLMEFVVEFKSGVLVSVYVIVLFVESQVTNNVPALMALVLVLKTL